MILEEINGSPSDDIYSEYHSIYCIIIALMDNRFDNQVSEVIE